jgi:hypothetical protein
MSVLATAKVPGDTDAFQKALAERGGEFKEIGDRARGVGANHHRFGMADGFVLVVDEWETAEQFQLASRTEFRTRRAPGPSVPRPPRVPGTPPSHSRR